MGTNSPNLRTNHPPKNKTGTKKNLKMINLDSFREIVIYKTIIYYFSHFTRQKNCVSKLGIHCDVIAKKGTWNRKSVKHPADRDTSRREETHTTFGYTTTSGRKVVLAVERRLRRWWGW